jgi:hypothetical protein
MSERTQIKYYKILNTTNDPKVALEHFTKQASEVLEELVHNTGNDGFGIFGIALLMTPDGNLAVLNNDGDEITAVINLSKAAEAYGATHVITACTAWMSHTAAKSGGRPSQAPDRENMLLMAVCKPDGTIVLVRQRIYKIENGEVAWDERKGLVADEELAKRTELGLPLVWGRPPAIRAERLSIQ